ncbi:interferon lambda-3-like [Elephas maximus indicus]|uniref:interferon lambda-3-like n=1 Tax=Elephas maximus indicus TaxID=99487 RepID=UPI0021162855|nr:interferon lambda-3-like [Elephas maximus indicus]
MTLSSPSPHDQQQVSPALQLRIPSSSYPLISPSLHYTDKVVCCLLALMLMSTMLTTTGAVPICIPSGTPLNARGCRIDQFKSLSPRELQAFQRAKGAFEESLLLKDGSCSSLLFPRTWDLRQLQVWERPVALEAELALTVKVLRTMSDSALGAVLDQPLHTLHHIHSKLRACVSAQPTSGPRPQSRLHRWLHRLQKATKKESQSCLEASVMFNLFRLLTRDLKCVASGDQCA